MGEGGGMGATNIVISLLVNTVALLAVAYILKNFHIKDFWSALKLAIVLALVNSFLRPLFIVISLPINILTLGLFTFVINAAMLKIAGALVSGVEVRGWWTAIIAAIALSIVATVLNAILFSRFGIFGHL